MRRVIPFLAVLMSGWAQENEPILTPEQIQQELAKANAQFEYAKHMFNPWYAGPLVTPSPSLMPVGTLMIQPYVFVVGSYAQFNKERESIGLTHNIYSLQALSVIQTGVTASTDFIVTPLAQASWSDHETGGGFADLNATFGFQVCPETLYVPKVKFNIQQTFPTGKYKDLSLNGLGLNATGGGSYQTQFSLATGKMIWWTYPYPLRLRFFAGYTLATPIHVTNFNAYGGGFGTRGTVKPGNKLVTDLGIELSFTQRWVFALDVVYVAQNRTKFHGNPGHTKEGVPATVGGPYNDNLSLAPAIEYNLSDSFQTLAGAQLSVYGRNSLNFVSGQLSAVWVW